MTTDLADSCISENRRRIYILLLTYVTCVEERRAVPAATADAARKLLDLVADCQLAGTKG